MAKRMSSPHRSSCAQASLRVSQPSQSGERPGADAGAQQQQSTAGFRPDDFPAAGPSSGGAGAAMPPRWAAAAGGGRGDLGLAEFPELPGALPCPAQARVSIILEAGVVRNAGSGPRSVATRVTGHDTASERCPNLKDPSGWSSVACTMLVGLGSF